ncbi:MAG: hypothetical protein ACREI2_16215, partial [Nitrospiraceae bacterium]
MAWEHQDGSLVYRGLLFIGRVTLCGILGGCSTLGGQPPSSTPSSLKVVVGPVILEAPITKSTQIHSFEEDPSPEIDPILLAQLKEEIRTEAQRLLTEHLARQNGLVVVPFDETRRLMADLGPLDLPLTDDQLKALGKQSGADVVVTALIHDYGVVRWQYWVTGWLLHVSVATTVVGAATAWNPAAMGIYLAVDATTDFPLWYGGASVFGWTFRPVRVHLDATQITNCQGLIWTDEELAVKVPGKTLAEYPPEDRGRKEIQLEVNLNRAMADLGETAGRKLKLQPC